MNITREIDSGVTIISVGGFIKLGESSREFATILQKTFTEGVRLILVDLSQTDQVDSTGIGELVGYIQRFTAEGGRIALLNPFPRVLNLIKLTNLDKVIPIFEDRSEAVLSLNSGCP